MGYLLAFEPLTQFGAHFSTLDGIELESATPTDIVLTLADGTTLALEGEGFGPTASGPLGGTVTGFSVLDGDHPVFTATGFDLSLAAVLGFAADKRLEDLAAYIFDGDDTQDGSYGGDLMAGFHGNDDLHGNGGDDTIDAGSGADHVAGEAGSDWIFGRADNDLIEGGDDGDVLFGNVGLDTLAGGAGDDTLYGGQDYDVLRGDDGDDLIHGDLGGDDLWGGAGNDTLIGGGDDYDWFYFASRSGQDRIEDFNVDGGDQIQIERHINNTGIVDFASLVDRIASDSHGDTIIDLGAGNYIRLVGIDADAVDARYFAFFDRGSLDPQPSDPPVLGADAA